MKLYYRAILVILSLCIPLISFANKPLCITSNEHQNSVRMGTVILNYQFVPENLTTGIHTDMLISLCESDQPFEGSVKVDANMPDHGHGMNYQAELKQVNNGEFIASGLYFHMPGSWQISIRLYGSKVPTVFNIEQNIY